MDRTQARPLALCFLESSDIFWNCYNDTANYATKAAIVIRFIEATDYINIEYVKTDIFSAVKERYSQASFASEAELIMMVLGSGADTTNIALYNFLSREGDALESRYDWLLKGIDISGVVAVTAAIYYTASEDINNMGFCLTRLQTMQKFG